MHQEPNPVPGVHQRVAANPAGLGHNSIKYTTGIEATKLASQCSAKLTLPLQYEWIDFMIEKNRRNRVNSGPCKSAVGKALRDEE